jgi:hypothetical protein
VKQTLTNLPVPRTENVGSILERDLDRTIAFRMGVVRKDGAYEHRMLRREPGYTVPMLMEESRILQGVIFKIRNNNLLFLDVMSESSRSTSSPSPTNWTGN